MKYIKTTLLFFFLFSYAFSQGKKNMVTYDVQNFWHAFDKITGTTDSALQYEYLDKLFLAKGSPGLKAIMQARSYTAKSYIEAINDYPLFWRSIRANTLQANEYAKAIHSEMKKLKKLYPSLKPAKIYFTIGALRTGGTALGDLVLIGSEIALADKHVVTNEFPPALEHLKPHFETNPIDHVVFMNVHEYIHTQQKTTLGNTLLAQCILEGAAEFVAVTATGKPSALPAILYGRENAVRVREQCSKELFNPFNGFWLYSNADSEFKVRDLGYYVGFAICENYYQRAQDKQKAIKEMIELDYNNEHELSAFVDRAGYFTRPAAELREAYEASRPVVARIQQLDNQEKNVDPTRTRLTIEFSKPMDRRYRNFELGPLGASNLMHVKQFIGFSDDGTSATIEVELKPGKQYQLLIGEGFRSLEGISLKPYLIDFTTAG